LLINYKASADTQRLMRGPLHLALGSLGFTLELERLISGAMATPAECSQVLTAQIVLIERIAVLPATSGGPWHADVMHRQIAAGTLAPFTVSTGKPADKATGTFPAARIVLCPDSPTHDHTSAANCLSLRNRRNIMLLIEPGGRL
jgi:hypothetical protein